MRCAILLVRSTGGTGSETARVHPASRRHDSGVAARGARAAARGNAGFTARDRRRRRPGKRREHAMIEVQTLDVRIPAEIIHNWGWFLAFGIGLVLLGFLAIGRSVAATVVSMLFFGWLLVIAAGIEVAQAIMVGKWAGLYHHWLAAVLFGVVGALMIWRPVASAEVLALLMGAFFLVAGLFQLITPFVVSLPDWGWHALNGLITLSSAFWCWRN